MRISHYKGCLYFNNCYYMSGIYSKLKETGIFNLLVREAEVL